MQNFKSFLLKETTENIYPEYSWGFHIHEVDLSPEKTSVDKQQMEKDIEKTFLDNCPHFEFQKFLIFLSKDSSSIGFKFTVKNEKITSGLFDTEILPFLRKVRQAIEDLPYIKVNNSVRFTQIQSCHINGVPSIKVNYPRIFLGPSNKKTSISLHDIHKKVDCEILFIETNKITDSVLGLLLIKNLKTINLTDFSVSQLPWFKILDKHFKGDKDILACQEDLIEAGFKEYAKL